jgi:hypothetical protein
MSEKAEKKVNAKLGIVSLDSPHASVVFCLVVAMCDLLARSRSVKVLGVSSFSSSG